MTNHTKPSQFWRAALEEEGFRPSKSLGQNFLLDTNCARSIARDARVGPGDRVLEVGAGPGLLTIHLAELGVDLLVVEIDPRLVRVARRFLADHPEVRFLEADVLAGKHAIAPEVRSALWAEGDWHLVANLPYAITGPLLASLVRLENPPRTMTVLVQKEVALRLTARPGEKAWGGLSARLGLTYRARSIRDVGAQLFWPRPRVESAVVRLETTREAPPAEEVAAYDRVVETLFQHRRKTVGSALKGLLGDRQAVAALLGRAEIDPRARPETLSPEDLLALARAAPGSRGGEAHG